MTTNGEIATQPTIDFEGVEIPDFGDRKYSYAVLEVTRKCNLRCKTCFFFQAFQHEESDLPDDVLIDRLRALQKRHEIKFISLVGGEPTLRPKILAAACEIFPQCVMFTNGTRPLPDLPLSIGVSLDGPEDINDEIRGAGVYRKVMDTVARSARPVFVQSVLSKRNFPVLEKFTESLANVDKISGVIYSIYVPQIDDDSTLAFTLPEREGVIDCLLALKDRYGEFILNNRRSLELMRSGTCKQVTDHCDMKTNSLALDYRLRRRQPCCYGEDVDCDLCAAPTPFSMAAKREAQLAGMPESPDHRGFPEVLSPDR